MTATLDRIAEDFIGTGGRPAFKGYGPIQSISGNLMYIGK